VRGRNDTLSHCGTGNAGEGSKHPADTRATFVKNRPTNVLAIESFVFVCELCGSTMVFVNGCCLTLDPS
jgi:hypothetical protein